MPIRGSLTYLFDTDRPALRMEGYVHDEMEAAQRNAPQGRS